MRALRVAAGWSQAELAVLVNDAGSFNWLQTTAQKVESGARALTMDELEVLSDLFGLTLDELFSELKYGKAHHRATTDSIRFTKLLAHREALMGERHWHVLRTAEIDEHIAEIDARLAENESELKGRRDV